jgi:hypothetical protein
VLKITCTHSISKSSLLTETQEESPREDMFLLQMLLHFYCPHRDSKELGTECYNPEDSIRFLTYYLLM